MSANKQSFDDLEKQLARDALEQALKDLHGVINKEIENNKEGFSKEIQKTLASFKQNLEKNVSEAIDTKLSSLFVAVETEQSHRSCDGAYGLGPGVLGRR